MFLTVHSLYLLQHADRIKLEGDQPEHFVESDIFRPAVQYKYNRKLKKVTVSDASKIVDALSQKLAINFNL